MGSEMCIRDSANIGYILSGTTSALTATTEKITLATDVASSGPNVSTATAKVNGSGNENSFYIVGYASKAIDKISIAANTLSTIAGQTVNVKTNSSVRLNPLMTHVYVITGNSSGACEKIAIATETSAAITSLSNTGNDPACNGSATKLYNLNGYVGSFSKMVYGVTYANDTNAQVAGMYGVALTAWASGI